MSTVAANIIDSFHWTPQPRVEAYVRSLVESFLGRCPPAAILAARLKNETGTRFGDWIDTIVLPDDRQNSEKLKELGFSNERNAGEQVADVYSHPQGMFPRLALRASPIMRILIKVESVADFAAANDLRAENIEGGPLAQMRQIPIANSDRVELWAIERHGCRGLSPSGCGAAGGIPVARCAEVFRTRARRFTNERDGFAHAKLLIDAAVKELGVDLTCDLFFAAEREYWQRRNRAAQVQKARQDRLGLGWANHDHHTYRSSREYFTDLIEVFEKLGFVCRERFYAGAESGWGAQVLEQPNTGVVIFADVDLSPEELYNDFAHEKLPSREKLGTVGLWCALHGEAFLQAGMHHLECQFDFDALRQQLEAEEGVRVMKPFTDFPYLRQAFTEGEVWPVDPERIDHLLSERRITPEQAERFREQGAIGSHLENLERNEGFKGFNQSGVSEIIARTDPRGGVTPLMKRPL